MHLQQQQQQQSITILNTNEIMLPKAGLLISDSASFVGIEP
jgi:hypothetical protein